MTEIKITLGEENIILSALTDPRAYAEGSGDDALIRIVLTLQFGRSEATLPVRAGLATSLVFHLNPWAADRLKDELSTTLASLGV